MTRTSSNMQAHVVDIRNIGEIEEKSFFVDTNVWFWFLSAIGYSDGHPYQVDQYPNFISSIFKKNKLFACVVNLVELSFIIEDTSYKIFCKENNSEITKKNYRYNYPEERKKIVEEINRVWNNLKDFASVLNSEIVADCDIDNILNTINESYIDAYDSLILHQMTKNGIECLISDDFDYSTTRVKFIYTANDKIVSKARSCGRLIS